jgi:hypothetical protein
MRIRFEGDHPLFCHSELRQAARFFANYLMDRQLHQQIDLLISFDLDQGHGGCSEIDFNNFEIEINSRLRRKNTLLTLAHEMVHLKQYAGGQLQYNYTPKAHKFLGKRFNKDMNYWDQPWEIEAFGRELGLVLQYKHWCKENGKKF